MIYNHIILSDKPHVHNLTDLQACYDRQLPNYASIIEELVGIERSPIKLFTKVLPILKHYIYTGYGISNQFYSHKIDPVSGIGQGIKLSEDLYWDKSYLIIKVLENENLGILINTPIIKQ